MLKGACLELRTVEKHGKKCYSLTKILGPFKLNIIHLIQTYFLPAYGSIEKVPGKMEIFQVPTVVFSSLLMVVKRGNLYYKDYLELPMDLVELAFVLHPVIRIKCMLPWMQKITVEFTKVKMPVKIGV